MHRKFNVRLLVWALAFLIPVGLVIHLLHGFQVRRHAVTLLERGDHAREQGQPEQALVHYAHYLSFVPDDGDAREKYVRLLDRVAAPADRLRVVQLMQKLLLDRPDLHDVRFRLIHNLIAIGRISDAVQQINTLVGRWGDPAELKHMLGWCQEAREQYRDAANSFQAAVRLDRKRLDSYALLAEVLSERLGEPDEAQRVLDAMVEANSTAYGSFLIRSRFHLRRGNDAAADKDLQTALALAPEQSAVVLAVADRLQGRGKLQEAFALLEEGTRLNPAEPNLYKAMADLKIRANERGEAIKILGRGLEKLPRAADLLTLQIDLLVDDGALAVAAQKVKELRRLTPASPLPDYLQGRIAVAAGHWPEATTLLELCRKDLPTTSAWAGRLHTLLGVCYRQAGDGARELAAYRRAVLSEPGWAAARMRLGIALLDGGRVEDAVAELQQARNGSDTPRELWTVLGRALLCRNLRLPESQRDWTEVEASLIRARTARPDSQEVTILQAEVLTARNDFAAAHAALQLGLDRARAAKEPGTVLLWCALAELAARQGQPADADRALEQAEAELGDSLEIRLTRCRMWSSRGDAGARKNLAGLSENVEKFGAAARIRLRRELAETWGRLGDAGRAEELWRKVANELAQDVRSRFALLELALQANQLDKARPLLAELRKLEGSQGMHWQYATAAVRVLAARGDRAELAAARKLLADLERHHPDWGRVPLLQARADELDGRFDVAIRHYERAVELGELQTGVVVRLVELLLERQEFLRAEEVLSRFSVRRPLTPGLARLGAEVAAGNRNAPLARSRSRLAVRVPSNDYRDYLWLAHVEQTAGAPAAAEALLREAVRLAEHAPDPWIALVEHLARTGQAAAAETVVSQLRQKLPPSARLLALARCHEALHQIANAEADHEQALAARPDDFIALTQAAEFYLRQDQPSRAEPLLRRLLTPSVAAPAEHAARARRRLAALLAPRRGRAEALALLAENGETAANERTRLYVLGQDPRVVARSIADFEESLTHQPASALDRLMLAELWLSAGKPAQARAVLQPLATQPVPLPQHLARYVAALIGAGDFDEAAGFLATLEQWEPQSSRSHDLRAALTKARANQVITSGGSQ